MNMRDYKIFPRKKERDLAMTNRNFFDREAAIRDFNNNENRPASATENVPVSEMQEDEFLQSFVDFMEKEYPNIRYRMDRATHDLFVDAPKSVEEEIAIKIVGLVQQHGESAKVYRPCTH